MDGSAARQRCIQLPGMCGIDRKIEMDSVARYGWIQLRSMNGFNCQVWRDSAARKRRIQLPGVDGIDCKVEMDSDARCGWY
jgi:hypothetical protein